MTKTKWLNKNLGGKWTYDGLNAWSCDDGVRHVVRYDAELNEIGQRITDPTYWLYQNGRSERLFTQTTSTLQVT